MRQTLITAVIVGFTWASAQAQEAPKDRESLRGGLRTRQFEAFSVPQEQVDNAFFSAAEQEMEALKTIIRQAQTPNQQADRLFRMADLYRTYDNAKYFRQMEAYNQRMDAFMRGKLKTKPTEPKRGSLRTYKVLQAIIQAAPKYQRLDEVLYWAGYYGEEIGDAKAGQYYRALVEKHPQSRYRLDAYMAIAEEFFLNRQFDKAIETYNIILREPSKIYNFALYKLAWCYYNQQKTRPAMTIMQKVVIASKGVQNEIELREEALRDLVLFYSDLGLVDEAQTYFTSIGEPEYGLRVLRRLADIYFEQARYDKAIYTIKRLLAADPYSENSPKYHSKLVDCFEKSVNLPMAINEMEQFILTYEKESIWYRRNTDNDVRDYAFERSEVYARFIPKKYHEMAQQTAKTNPEDSAQKLRLAVDYYRKYLDRFGEHKNAYDMRLLYAELLFKNKDFAAAATQYETVAKTDKKGKHRKAALIGQIDSLSRLEEEYFKGLETKGIKKKDKYEPIPLSLYAQRLIEADEGYVGSFPTDAKVPDTLLHRSQLFYNYNQFDRAQKGFQALVGKFPTAPASNTARNLILDIYNIQKDWDNLEKWASTFLNDKAFATPENRTLLLKLIQGSIFKKAEAMEAKKDYLGAADAYLRLANKYPDSEYADKALFNATVAYISADQSENAMKTAQRFLKRYPESDLTPKMMLALATYFDDKLDYSHAAEYYEFLAEKDTKSPQAADALFNAGLYRENLGHFAKALQNYQTYLERYPRSKDAAEIFFSVGLVHEKQSNWKEAAATFSAYPKRFSANRERNIEAYYRYGQAMAKLRQTDAATKAYQSAVYLNRKYNETPAAGPNVGARYAAKSHLELIEPELREYSTVKLRMPQAALAAAIEKKANMLKRLRSRLLEVINYGDAESGVAALYRIGFIYQEFADALFNAPVPKGLTPEEVQQYQQELQSRASPIEEKAIEAYEKAVKKAYELDVYTDWAKKSYERLTQYKPDLYPPQRGISEIQNKISEPRAPYKPTERSASR